MRVHANSTKHQTLSINLKNLIILHIFVDMSIVVIYNTTIRNRYRVKEMNSLKLSIFIIVTFVNLICVVVSINSLTLKVKSSQKTQATNNACIAKIKLASFLSLAMPCDFVISFRSFWRSFGKVWKRLKSSLLSGRL